MRHSFTGNPLHHTKSASVAGAWLWKYFVAKRANASSLRQATELVFIFSVKPVGYLPAVGATVMDDAFRLCHCQQVADGVSIVNVYS